MEHIDGVNLRQAMWAGRFSPGQVLAIIEAELRESGKGNRFDLLKPWLTGDADKRFRAVVKAEIAQTVNDEESVHEEMAALIAALRG